ncbi:MAG: NADPH-dependent reductase [Conexibacter sp.]|nr:NADPH-dependent reductase [Conexibacter sp.]
MPSTSFAIVLGSVTPPGRLHAAIAAASTRASARHPGLEPQLLDLAELTIPFADGRPPEGDTAHVIDRLTNAGAVLFATPVYRGSLTGALKNLLDHVPVAALRDTPTGIASMGASDHHFLGVERHLRDILAFFGTLTAPTAAYLTSRDFADGAPTEEALTRLDALIDTIILLAERAGDAPLGPPPLGAGRG